MIFSSRTFTSTLILGATLALPSLAQDEKPQAIRAPGEPVADPNHREPDEMEGDRVTESFFWVESMEEVMEREAREGPVQPLNHRLRNGRDGEWEVAGTRTSHFPHSGIHYVFNKWGDTRMGIGFRREVNLSGAWMVRFGNNGAVARGVQIVGFRNGEEVARTGWFRDLDEDPGFFAMNLDRVDRIEFVAEAAVGEAGWFGMDDLTFTDLSTGLEEIIDFEDLNHEDSLTGSGYAGLVWESGSGFTTEVDLTSVPPPMEDANAGTGGGSNRPGGGGIGPGGNTSIQSGNGTLPILLQNFNGTTLGDTGAGFIPPDTCGAVGIDHFVSVVNANISVYEKAAPNTQVVNLSLQSFFGGFNADPRVVFDPDSQRFIVASTDFSNKIYIAVSTTSDPTGSWFKGSFNPSQGSDQGKWPDYPTLGVDQRGIYTAAYMVGGSAQMSLFAIDKAPLIAANPSFGAITAFRSLAWEGAIQPAVHWDDAGGAYAVSYNSNNRIRVRRVNPPLSNPTLSNVGFVNMSSSWSSPPDAPASGSSTNLDTLEGRFMNAVYRNGSVWTTHCVGTGGRASSRYYEIDPVSLSQIQLGTVRDNVNQTLHFFMPSIAVNSQGHAVLGGSVSSPDQFAGCFYTGRLASDPPGEMAFPFEYKSGSGAYNQLDGAGRNRWGDYSLTSADPVDDTVWTVQEFARTGNRWRINIAQLDFETGDCDPVKYCNPGDGSANNVATIDISSCDLLSGTSVNLSNAPANQFTYLLIGDGNSVVQQPPGAKGDLCVLGGACLGRYAADIGSVSAAGTFSTDISNSISGGPNFGIPTCGGTIQAGDTWSFQYWHRQPMGQPSTFSEAISVTFN